LVKGSFEFVTHAEGIVSFIREHEGQSVFCAFNLTNMAQPVTLPEGEWQQDQGAPFTTIVTDKDVTLPPYQAYFGVRAETV